MAWQRFNLKVSKTYSKEERRAIATEVIDFIVKRSRSGGKDKNNRTFKPYSQSYKDSLDFKIAGKGSKVNVSLSGDMLDSIELLSQKSGNLLIGFENSTFENDKAEGNITGSYGQKSPNSSKARDFLGITNKDLKVILSEFPIKDKDKRKERTELILGDKES